METKNWYASWTLWFNVLGGVILSVAGALGEFKDLAPYIAPATLLGNFLLRFKTNTAIDTKPATDKAIG